MTASAGPVLKRLFRDYSDQVAFLSVYVREAHPGEHYPQAESFDQKKDSAQKYKLRDAIPWPVAVDTVDGKFHRALGATPNSAWLMDTEGKVVFSAILSNDERRLRLGLETFLTAGEQIPLDDKPGLVSLLRGAGVMYEVLDLSGAEAKSDMRNEAPSLYGLARLASLFRPFPHLARSLLALGTMAGAVGAAAWGGSRLVRSEILKRETL